MQTEPISKITNEKKDKALHHFFDLTSFQRTEILEKISLVFGRFEDTKRTLTEINWPLAGMRQKKICRITWRGTIALLFILSVE